MKGHRSEWDLDLRRAERWSQEKLRAQEKNDEVIAHEERKVASSEEGRGVKLTRVSLVQLFDLHGEKSRKMKRRGKSVPGGEVRIFKRLFIADLKSDGWENKWAEK